MTNEFYPHWVCFECGNKFVKMPKGYVFTSRVGICIFCKEKKLVSPPRDFGFPDFKLKASKEG